MPTDCAQATAKLLQMVKVEPKVSVKLQSGRLGAGLVLEPTGLVLEVESVLEPVPVLELLQEQVLKIGLEVLKPQRLHLWHQTRSPASVGARLP